MLSTSIMNCPLYKRSSVIKGGKQNKRFGIRSRTIRTTVKALQLRVSIGCALYVTGEANDGFDLHLS